MPRCVAQHVSVPLHRNEEFWSVPTLPKDRRRLFGSIKLNSFWCQILNHEDEKHKCHVCVCVCVHARACGSDVTITYLGHSHSFSSLIYPLTARVVGALQMVSQQDRRRLFGSIKLNSFWCQILNHKDEKHKCHVCV